MKSKLIETVSAGWSDVEKLGICSYLSYLLNTRSFNSTSKCL